MFSSRVDPPDDVILTVRCCHANGKNAADVMLFTLVITGALQLAGLLCTDLEAQISGKSKPIRLLLESIRN
jgi:hypothetical protein